jgi:hypothetical protein
VRADRAAIAAALDQAVLDTFEHMAFMESTPIDEATGSNEAFRSVRLGAAAPLACEIALAASDATLGMLAEGLYPGLELTPETGNDVLAELLNVIAGRFLAELDDSVPIEMGLPSPVGDEPSASNAVERVYQVDVGSVRARVVPSTSGLPLAEI